MTTILFIVILFVAFAAGVLASSKIASTHWANVDLQAAWKAVDYWADRYQTFLGVLVAIMVASLTVSAMGKQNSISERQFLAGQVQSLTVDRGNLQFVIEQLNGLKFQKTLFENNISFLDPEGDKTTGWQNGGNYIRRAFSNIENFRGLVAANTSKFMEPTGMRADLISKLDAIVNSQDRIREAFLSWANLNRLTNADPTAPAPAQKAEYLQAKAAVIALFDKVIPAANAATSELNKKVVQTENDIAGLQKAIDSKALD